MLLGLALLYVGAVLTLNGLWLLGKIEDREITFINVVSGFITLCVALYSAFGPGADAGSVRGAALTLLFTTTYLWVAYNRVVTVDGRGLGWFSLFVAITVVPVAIGAFKVSADVAGLWMAFNWTAWAVLWFMYFLLLALKRPILPATGVATLLVGIFTGWLPGLLMLEGKI
ncbi:MAG: AmiS/UreI family transporter [Afipia sp.]|nr:AmiS/UreI family transporter [Afipia sp.]OJW65675.1 MAG: transporter [Afipia sp. 64-13]